jgi:hypothetical protein
MDTKRFAFAATLGALVICGAGHAHATAVNIRFAGQGVSGALVLTYGTATDAKYSTAREVTGISGRFSDSNNSLNIVDAPVLGLVPIVRAQPEPTNLLAPNDFSRFAVAANLPPENNGSLSYDNLFWPRGSPQTASDYPFHGGFLDIYGLMFDLGNGRVVNFWSNGVTPGSSAPNYGVAVATSATALDYLGDVTATLPEPDLLWLLSSGLAGWLFLRHRRGSATAAQ